MGPLSSIPLTVRIFTMVGVVALFAGIVWVLYQQATFLHDVVAENETGPHSQDVSILPDSLTYGDYTIVRTLDLQDSTYGVAIFKNKQRVWRSREGTIRPEDNEVKLVSLFRDGTKQLYVQHFSGGAHCCWTSIILELSDSVHTLFHSDDYTDLGYQLTMSDLDRDGMMDLHLTIMTFDNFDRLTHAISPFSSAYFTYSLSTRRFILTSRKFSSLVLNKTQEHELRVKAMADTTDFTQFEDIGGDYLSSVLKVLMDYVFAGQKEQGWKFFDTWYRLADKDEIRHKIQQTFEASNLYQELYTE
ncbi:MAG: hypothetical protein HW374_1346 [Bacteroidetes bacterium]|nr:hypothetical protein [Bacteroidota bacterium]